MLKHIVFSQKKADRKKKCIQTAENIRKKKKKKKTREEEMKS